MFRVFNPVIYDLLPFRIYIANGGQIFYDKIDKSEFGNLTIA